MAEILEFRKKPTPLYKWTIEIIELEGYVRSINIPDARDDAETRRHIRELMVQVSQMLKGTPSGK